MTIDIDRLVPLQTALKKLHSATSVEDKLEASTLVRNELVKLGVLSDIDDTSSPKDNRASIGAAYEVITSWDIKKADNKFQELLEQNNSDHKKSAMHFFKEYLSDRAVKTTLGLVVLNSKSKNKMTWQAKREPIALATPRIPQILLEGKIGAREPANKERSDSFIAFYEFSKIITVASKDYHARIKVAEREMGDHAAYNLTSRQLDGMYNEENPSHLPHWLNKSDLDNQPSLRRCDELLTITSHSNNDVNDSTAFDDVSYAENVGSKTAYEILLDTLEVQELEPSNSEYSDNPNDDNYRYADTGYIAGSKKELASNRIKELAKDGVAVKVKDIDWSEIETDALLAESLIKKSNIMGQVDYNELKDNGIEPGTAFLIQKVLASVATEPHWDLVEFAKNSYAGRRNISYNQDQLLAFARLTDELGAAQQKQMMRKAYVAGIDTLKARISKCVTPRDLYNELVAIAGELGGSMLSSDVADKYKTLSAEQDALRTEMEEESEALYKEAIAGLAAMAKEEGINPIEYNIQKWVMSWATEKYPERQFSGSYIGKGIVDANKFKKWKEYNIALKAINAIGAFETLTTNRSIQQWVALGERFWAIIERTSSAFVKHLNLAIDGKYNDWGLTITDSSKTGSGGKKGKKKTTFELIVAEQIERKGGKEVVINSTKELKDEFGFRDIQSGDWILKEKSSAEFHVKNTAAAMFDLSDIIGIDHKALGFNGRLAMAFGARGRGGALAHYEPVQRVINLTKMRGGGSLGHEWFHAIDNILGEILGNEEAVGANNYLTENPSLASNPKISNAFRDLQDAMFIGDTYTPEVFKLTEKDIELAKLNINPDKLNRTTKAILDAGNASGAVRAIDDMYGRTNRSRRSKRHTAWRKVAAAYYNQDKAGEAVILETGPISSKFKANSVSLDGTRAKPYWSTTVEMAARAFQAYLEDSLEAQGRRNDYLSYGANNDLYDSVHKAYPEGDERARINAAFDKLFKVIKDEKVFENASADESLMDSIFGMQLSNNLALDHLIRW